MPEKCLPRHGEIILGGADAETSDILLSRFLSQVLTTDSKLGEMPVTTHSTMKIKLQKIGINLQSGACLTAASVPNGDSGDLAR